MDKAAPINTTITINEENPVNGNGTNGPFNEKSKIPSASKSGTQSGYFSTDPENDMLQTKYSNSSKDGLTFNNHHNNNNNNNINQTFHYNGNPYKDTNLSPISPSQSPDISFGYDDNNNNNNNYTYTSSDIIFNLKDTTGYLYIDLCKILVNGFCRGCNIHFYYNMAHQQWNMLNVLIFDFYFEYQRHIEQFGHDLWKTLVVIEIAEIPNGDDIIRGFTGYRLIKHIKQYLQRYTINKFDNDLESLCMSLIKYSYIRLAAITDLNKNLIEKLPEKDKDNFNKNIFVNDRNYLYQFENKRHRGFIKSDEPDRQSWYKSCNVQIYSSTLKGWTIGQVIDIQNDLITVQYDNASTITADNNGYHQLHHSQTQQMRKTVDRYQDNVIKSTPQFIYARKNWIKDSQLEVYSNRYQSWFIGHVTEVILKSNNPTQYKFDILRVIYKNNQQKEFNKYVERWSKDLREVQYTQQQQQQQQQPHQLPPQQQQQPYINNNNNNVIWGQIYKKGTNVMVWSNSKQMWIPGIVTQIIQDNNNNNQKIVNVRYGDFEKLMPWYSNDIRLCDENALHLLETYKKHQTHY